MFLVCDGSAQATVKTGNVDDREMEPVFVSVCTQNE